MAGAVLLASLAGCQNLSTEDVLDVANAPAPPADGAGLAASFLDPAWNGQGIPTSGLCARLGGGAATPALIVNSIAPGASTIRLSFDRAAFDQAAEQTGGNDGELGILSLPVQQGASDLIVPSIAAGASGGIGIEIVSDNRLGTVGYAAPCDRGSVYFVDISALDPAGAALARTRLQLGRL